MNTQRVWYGAAALVLAAGCYTASDSGGEQAEVRRDAIDWQVVELKLPHHESQDPSRHGVLMYAYPGYPKDMTPKVIKDYLEEIRAFTKDWELYDQAGRPIYFITPDPRPCGDKWTQEEYRREKESYDQRRADLDKQYRVIVIERAFCGD